MSPGERRDEDRGEVLEERVVTTAAMMVTGAVVATVWLACGTVLAVIAAVAPGSVFEEDWGFGLMTCIVLGIAAWTTRTVIREM